MCADLMPVLSSIGSTGKYLHYFGGLPAEVEEKKDTTSRPSCLASSLLLATGVDKDECASVLGQDGKREGRRMRGPTAASEHLPPVTSQRFIPCKQTENGCHPPQSHSLQSRLNGTAADVRLVAGRAVPDKQAARPTQRDGGWSSTAERHERQAWVSVPWADG